VAARLHTKTDLKAVLPRRTKILTKGLCKLAKFGKVATDFSMKLPVKKNSISAKFAPAKIEICILAGGQSSRMGRDKSKLRLGGKTLVARIRHTTKALTFPTRMIRHDLMPKCGPLGGIYTALKTSSADAVLFLACDMPQISELLLKKILEKSTTRTKAIFTWNNGAFGFPFLLKRSALVTVEQLLAEKQFSLQTLARKIRAQKFQPVRNLTTDLLNVNTPADWIELQKKFSEKN
jgi:molybdopterin-guanine dinucleotide biosynthesis protein A